MTKPTLILALLFLSFTVAAQNAVHASFAPGFSFVRVSGNGNLQHNGMGHGIAAKGTLAWDLKKDWLEGGAGIELGKMAGKVNLRDTITIGGVVTEYWNERPMEFASPYANVHMLMNAKWILAEGKYLYGGGVIGGMYTRSGLLYNQTVFNWYTGLTAGAVFTIDDITGLDISAGWRRVKLNGRGYDAEKAPGILPEHFIESFTMKYITLSVGIVVHFR